MQDKRLNFRDEILLYALQQYGTEPEFLWKKHPTYAVLRHPDNRKWYAILMEVARSVFGLAGEQTVPVMNVKCHPNLLNSFLTQPGFFPAYHMNKANWLGILLDGSVDKETIVFLLNGSFDLTATRQRKQKLGIRSRIEWIVPANPKYYDVEQVLEVGAELLWKQSNNIAVGDIVYIYVTAPTAAIRCKCEALEVNLPYKSERTDLRIEKVMRLKCLNVYRKELLPKALLQSFGVSAVRGPRKMPFSLSEEIIKIASV
ncbi:MmcQ/YjbR family DNA-binding protein [Actinobacillus capsulatus]|uniref:MmcQ/YjbR family DNA-binding protein n=1 Tax=Actinobacillus capsulatus TaxID=717 RepID=UPI00037FE710|nr:MmcQ/YjbR family DNA-binding protein [Actinobacillus capsulatus]